MAPTEHEDQVRLVAYLRARSIPVFAVPNAAKRNPKQAAWLKAEGLESGAPDLVIGRLSSDGRPVVVEMKRSNLRGGVSNAQRLFLAKLSVEGWVTLVCYGFAHAVESLTKAGVLRGFE